MRRFRLPAVLIAALAVSAAAAATALAAHTVAFTATFSGTATEKVSGQTVNAVARGQGTGNLVGRSTINGAVVADISNPPCGPFNGPGTIVGKKGKLRVTVLPTSRGCAASEEDQNNISLSGTVRVKGGTGKFLKARGSLHFSGHYDRGTGAFTVKLTGALRLK